MHEDARSLEKTIKSFEREAKHIAASTGTDFVSPRVRRPVLRVVIAALLGLQLICVVIPPFTYPAFGTVTSRYTLRRKPDRLSISLETHKGIDIAVPAGTSVRSAAPGRIISTGRSPTSGNYVLVRHLFGFSTFYAHLSRISATEKAFTIFKLLPIGEAGSTGRSTGSHVHFEIRFLGVRLPPGPFLFYHTVRRWIFRW